MPPISESRAEHNTGNYDPYFFFNKCVGSLMSPTNQYQEDAGDRTCSFSSLSEKTRMSNCLQMS